MASRGWSSLQRSVSQGALDKRQAFLERRRSSLKNKSGSTPALKSPPLFPSQDGVDRMTQPVTHAGPTSPGSGMGSPLPDTPVVTGPNSPEPDGGSTHLTRRRSTPRVITYHSASIAQVNIAGKDGGPAATRVAGALSTAEQHVAVLSDRLAGSRLKIQAAQAQLNRLSILSSRADTAAESELGGRNKALEVEIETLATERDVLKQKLHGAFRKVETTTHKTEVQYDEEIKRLKQQLKDSERRANTAQTRTESLTNENALLKKQLRSADEKNRALMAAQSGLTIQLEELKTT